MNKTIIDVPDYVEYISNWKNFSIPHGHCIYDKTVTGCGFTEYALTNEENVILCSPRRLLLENKIGQHSEDFNIFYLNNSNESIIDFDKPKDDTSTQEVIVQNFSLLSELEKKVSDHYYNCLTNLHQPCKILVTYDSLKYVLNALGNSVNSFRVVVDEFQSIFLDSYFKADIEFDFVEYLSGLRDVVYLSATPMLDKYLEQLDYFKDLPYYELNWPPTYVETIRVERRRVKSLVTSSNTIIQDYLNGKFPQKIDSSGNIRESKEVVFYVNSVSMITQLIKKNNLTQDNVNVICSNCIKNEIKLKKAKVSIGTIPKKGEPHKMFTFCTRTSYLGADFYSTCASTIILSDANIDSLALDISLDLPQIIGRQRDKKNVFKSDCTILFKTLRESMVILKEEYQEIMDKKKEKSRILLGEYEKMSQVGKIAYSDKLRDALMWAKYSHDFVGVSRKTGYAIYNYFIEIADWRAWEVSQVDYQDSLSVTRSIDGAINKELLDTSGELEKIIDSFLFSFYKAGDFRLKMKMYCEFMEIYKEDKEVVNLLYFKLKEDRFHNYYNFYGPERIKSLAYEDKPLRRGISDELISSNLENTIYDSFKINFSYTLKEIKDILRNIYSNIGISKSPKASDIENYFTTKKASMIVNGKRENGLKLISKIYG